MSGTLFVVATPIGNLEDITARALRVLREASLIAAEDTRRTAHLLARYAITTSTTSLHEHNEGQKMPALLARLEHGDSVALVSDAGTPTVSDPGRRLITAALDAGIRVEPIPGPSAPVAALAVSGMPADSFTFLGFPPTKAKSRSEWFARGRQIGGTVIFFEAPHRIRRTLEEAQHEWGDCPIMVCRELTKSHEELVRGPTSTVIERLNAEQGEFTVVANIGLTPKIVPPEPPRAGALLIEFGELTENKSVARRVAVGTLATKYGMRPNDVYELIEKAKSTVKQQN